MTNQSTELQNHLLKAQLATLVAKGECEYFTPSFEVQQLLISKYNVEPPLEKIINTLSDLWAESTYVPNSFEYSEDFFEGY